MAGMKFLNLKGWHPSNARNQKRIWIAEQQAKNKAQAEREAAAEVRKHAEFQRFQALAAANGDADSARRSEQLQVGFLYAPPPGLQKVDEDAAQDMAEDDAVREFRRKIEKKTAPAQGGDAQKPLERYVGRRPDEMLTIKEQVERFPFLKDAPVEGDYASNVKVNFKPMGRQLRNVKCIRCGEWGHASGDRECTLRDANPHDAARQAREDPMAVVERLKKEGQLVLKRAALPLEMQRGDASGRQEFEILLSDEESSDPEKAFLASLSTKEKRSLLKKLREHATGNKHARSSEGASSCSSDSSNEDEQSRKKPRRNDARKKTKHRKSKRPRTEGERGDREKQRPRGEEALLLRVADDRWETTEPGTKSARSRSRSYDRKSRRRGINEDRRRHRRRSHDRERRQNSSHGRHD